jgi:hypothetical protein
MAASYDSSSSIKDGKLASWATSISFRGTFIRKTEQQITAVVKTR